MQREEAPALAGPLRRRTGQGSAFSVRVGHWSDPRAMTGCTLIELPEGSVGSYEVRGGAPATRELDVLHPQKTVARVDGVLLTGGSAFGLAAADGVMRWMEEQGRGVPPG
ncbi:P1 family peptidase, partial [Arthrobacter sp. JCM 19049]|uniref:P1 family peptidase n=1 Tax=Arthrobacter sp. JCM 19049 TaxID=1460643 RepID=UPI000A8FE691